MKTIGKRLTMSIEYESQEGLESSINYFLAGLKSKNTNHAKIRTDSAKLEWSIAKALIPDYRVENIEGVVYKIVQSKMNQI
tara:strand:- start:820 stop:1062 length:243 start_codon:yes stop_codon:yes gene_type:complete